jgi:PTH1 family peptidyl-tRNA hydrolase
MGVFRRRSSPSSDREPVLDWLVVGLGNPGAQYRETRHNVGQAVAEQLCARHSVTLKAGRDNSMLAEMRIGDQRVGVAVPLTFMNNSGQAVSALIRRYRIAEPERLVVVHDELDLEPGTVRVKRGGGLAGHNGLRSITQHLSTQDYLRIRIGVGKPPSREQGARHVLERINRRDQPVFDLAISEATDAIETLIERGVDAASQIHNAR